MKTINFLAGTTHVRFDDLDRLIAIAETPNEYSLSERMEHSWMLAEPLLKAVRNGELRVRSPRTGNELYPPDIRSELLLCSVVDVLDLQAFTVKYREMAVRVGGAAPASLTEREHIAKEQERMQREQKNAIETAKLSEIVRQTVINDAEEARQKRRAASTQAPVQADTQSQGALVPTESAFNRDKPDQAGPLPLTTNDIANCFAGFREWDVKRWKRELGSPDNWLRNCQHRRGTPGRGGHESTWWPAQIALALANRDQKLIRNLHARFKRLEPLKPWLEELEVHVPDNSCIL